MPASIPASVVGPRWRCSLGDLGDKRLLRQGVLGRREMLVFKASALCGPGEIPGTGACVWVTTGDPAACRVVLAQGERDHVDPSDVDLSTTDSDAPANDLPAAPSSMPSGEELSRLER